MRYNEPMNVHLVGIKGVAMTALALIYQDRGDLVTGSDVAEDFVTKQVLNSRKIKPFLGFSPKNVGASVDCVVYTGAHGGENNVEVRAAIERGIPVLSHAKALGDVMEGKTGISVCGTGGKTTTSAMIAWILEKAKHKPSYAVGVGSIQNLGVPGRFVKDSNEFVAEADEYAVDPHSDLRPRFIYQKPSIIVCTNLRYDHPDIYPSFDKTKEVFINFFNTLPDDGALIISGDDEVLVSLTKHLATKARVIKVESPALVPELSVPGTFNRMNAALALQVAILLGVDQALAKQALSEFKGTMRRFEYKGMVNGAECFDDYAHTPHEIQSTLEAFSQRFPKKKKIVVFQPHTYSRTKSLFDEFSKSFSNADDIYILDIFASARESIDLTIRSEDLVQAINAHHKRAFYIPSMDALVTLLKKELTPECACITIGAGDIYTIYDRLL